MLVQARDQNGQPILGAGGQPLMIEVGEQPRVDVDQIAREAAERGRQEVNAALQAERTQRETLERQLAERDAAERQRQLQALPPDQQVVARLTGLESQLAQERAERARMATQHSNEIRTLGLVAYRERALRDAPPEVHAFVNGSNEQEIDAAVDAAVQTYQAIEQSVEARLQAQSGQPQVPPGYVLGNDGNYYPMEQQQPLIAAPPPNPAYTPVLRAMPGVNGFATPVNAQPLPLSAEEQPGTDVTELTTEEAVRSGRYGGEMRAKLLQSLKGAPYSGSVGSNPRHLRAAQPQTVIPGGGVQPQGFPTGPVQPSQMRSPQVQPVQGARLPANNARAQALAAIQRTHDGSNPVLGENLGAHQALNESQSFAQQRGIQSPNAAFRQRFTHTPPITQN